MKFIKRPWFIPIVLTIIILAVGGYFIRQLISDVETLPEHEIRKQLEETYGGKVERLSLEGTMFEVELSRNKDVYLATVDAETGKVLSLIQTKEVIGEERPIAAAEKDTDLDETKKTEPLVQNNVQTGTTVTEPKQPATSEPPKTTTVPKKTEPKTETSSPGKSTSNPTPPKISTTVLISEKQAMKIAQGQLKGEVEEVEFVSTNDGGYYLVEIDDNNDNEATFQIHAISGKILSVTRDE